MGSEKKIVLLVILVCWLRSGLTQNDSVFSGKALSSFTLYHATGGKSIHLPAASEGKSLSVFIFLSPECPLSQSYLPLLNSLNEKYTNNISFYGIIPGKAYSAKIVTEFALKYRVGIPLLIDSSKSLTTYMHATITPEIILLDNKNNLVYKGAVDDLLMDLGKRRVKATSEYLNDAIIQSLGNKAVSVKRTKAVGCRINDY